MHNVHAKLRYCVIDVIRVHGSTTTIDGYTFVGVDVRVKVVLCLGLVYEMFDFGFENMTK